MLMALLLHFLLESEFYLLEGDNNALATKDVGGEEARC